MSSPSLTVRIGAYMTFLAGVALLVSPLFPYLYYTLTLSPGNIPPTDNFHPVVSTAEALFGFVIWATWASGSSNTIYMLLSLVVLVLSFSTTLVPLICSNALLRGKPQQVFLAPGLTFASIGFVLSVIFDIFNLIPFLPSFQANWHNEITLSLGPGFWLPPLLFLLCIGGNAIIAVNSRFTGHFTERQHSASESH
jgi:hypothetical protein